jgi:hypothetical protein
VPRLDTVRQVQEEDAAGARVRPPKGDTQVAPFFSFFATSFRNEADTISQELFSFLRG